MESRRGGDVPVRERPQPVAVAGCPVDGATSKTMLSSLDRPRLAWSTGDLTVVGGGAAVVLTADGPDRFESIRRSGQAVLEELQTATDLPELARPRLFGGFSFHDGHTVETGDHWAGFPGARFVLPTVQFTDRGGERWLTTAARGPDAETTAQQRLERWQRRLAALPNLGVRGPPGIGDRRPNPDRAGWRDQVTAALDQVRGGSLRKVVLAQSLNVDLAGELTVADLLARLARTYPDCTRFCFEPVDGGSFVGATPERLVAVDGRTVQTDVLAGSTGRGDTVEEDEWLAGELTNSEKDVHEHAVVLEAVRDQLAPLTTEVEQSPRRVRKLATVQHLQTQLRARLDGVKHVLELVEALHPTPAVGGMPQDAALRTIRETESFDRGWYAAPVGWFDAAGDGEFAVAIRSAVTDDHTARLFAGAGIVADSDPDSEWDELQLKYRPILDELA